MRFVWPHYDRCPYARFHLVKISPLDLLPFTVYLMFVNATTESCFLALSPSTEIFEELTAAVQEKDSLASELQVRHIAIEQLFKNCAKLPWLHISRAGIKASSSGNSSNSNGGPVEWSVAMILKFLHVFWVTSKIMMTFSVLICCIATLRAGSDMSDILCLWW